MVYVLIFCLIVMIFVINSLVVIYMYGKKYIVDMSEMPKNCDAIIILGAGIREDGTPCDILADRLDNGVKVYLQSNCKAILLSGDNSGEFYNELMVMKNWIQNKYPKENIRGKSLLIDDFGFCTYDSMRRAKRVYNIKSAIISTNKYHLPRAIYVARRMGIDAYGVPSDMREYDRMKKYKKREILAQIKDFFLCLIKIH